MNTEVEKILVDIIVNEMDLSDQNVWIQSQNRKIPETDDLFIVVGFVDAQVIVNKNSFDTDTDPISEIQEIVQRENIQIDIMSSSNDARERRAEVLMALNSVYSEQQQEENDFRIFTIPTSFVNTSQAEGGSTINRFTIVLSCNVWYRKTKSLEALTYDYYDDFTTRVDDENSVATDTGIIEFEIEST